MRAGASQLHSELGAVGPLGLLLQHPMLDVLDQHLGGLGMGWGWAGDEMGMASMQLWM